MMKIGTAILLTVLLSSVAAYGNDSNSDMSGATPAASQTDTDTRDVTDDANNTRDATDKDSDTNDKCQKAWDKYRESEACFAPYRLPSGGFMPEAFKHCKNVVQPAYCE